MKKTYNIIVSDGQKEDAFSVSARNRHEAHNTVHISLIGSGWHIKSIKPKEKNAKAL